MKLFAIIIFLAVTQDCLAADEQIDPFADNVITCKEMYAYPEKVFAVDAGVDLGSGTASPVDVDYECFGGLASLPFLQHLQTLADSIGNDSCLGSMRHAYWRYYQFDLLRAGLAPNILLQSKELRQSQVAWPYFKRWSIQSPSNYFQYKKFMAELNKVQPILIRHYQRSFDFTLKQARAATREALSLFIGRAIGYEAQTDESVGRLPKIVQLYQAQKVSMVAVKAVLATKPSEDDIDQALKLALLNHKPIHLITPLITRLKAIDHGDESALFFALDDWQYVELLLRKGAAIDYANSFGKTALFYHIERNNHQMVERFIKHGANPNHSYKTAEELAGIDCTNNMAYDIQHAKRTPLMHAAQHADVDMLKILLNYGANLVAVDDLGFNALDYAIKYHRPENMAFLQSVGLKPNVDPQN